MIDSFVAILILPIFTLIRDHPDHMAGEQGGALPALGGPGTKQGGSQQGGGEVGHHHLCHHQHHHHQHHPENNCGPTIVSLVQFEEDYNTRTLKCRKEWVGGWVVVSDCLSQTRPTPRSPDSDSNHHRHQTRGAVKRFLC